MTSSPAERTTHEPLPVVLAILAVMVGVTVMSGTSSPTPLTAVLALAYGVIMAAVPVAFWYAFDERRRQRRQHEVQR